MSDSAGDPGLLTSRLDDAVVGRMAASQRLLIRVSRKVSMLREAYDRFLAGLAPEPRAELAREIALELDELAELAVSRSAKVRCADLRALLAVLSAQWGVRPPTVACGVSQFEHSQSAAAAKAE